jgi:RimJ/RimL family protein N-acetyltransferase
MYESLSAEAVRWGMPPYTRDRIEKWWLSNLQNLIPIVALHGDRIVGHAQISTPAHARRKGTADLAMYLHQDFHNVGLGAAMLPKLLELARREGLRRVGLTVVAENARAVRLYEKFGFKVKAF